MTNDPTLNKKTMLDWALMYLKYYSIIPVGSDKKPLFDWKEFQTRKPTEEEVRSWFDKINPPNIGIVTGKISGITVVDIEAGGEWLKYPSTQTAKSGRGGYHLYYKYADGVGNKVRVAELTDIRSEGGFVVAPPSFTTGNYEWIKKEQIQPFPYTFFNLTPTVSYDPLKWKNLLEGVSEGGRNQTSAQVLGRLLNSFHPNMWNSVVWDIFSLWNQRNKPPLKENELRTVFNSIVGTRIRTGDVQKRLNEDKPQEDSDIKLISEIAKDLSDDLMVKYPTGFKTIDEAFRGGFKEGDLVFVTGYTGTGKTAICQSITYNLAKIGHPTLWFSFEVVIGELWRKFKEMGVDDSFQAYAPEKNVTQALEWVHKKIIEARDTYKTKIVFIDHLGFLSQEPKNYDSNYSNNLSSIYTAICRRLKTIAIQEGIIIYLMGHLRKPMNGMTQDPTVHDIKDSAGVAQEADAVLIINRERDKGNDDVFKPTSTFKVEKNRATGICKRAMVVMENNRLVEAPTSAEELRGEVERVFGNKGKDLQKEFNGYRN